MRTTVEQTIKRAQAMARQGKAAEAEALYRSVLDRFPNNRNAQAGLAALSTGGPSQQQAPPPRSAVDALLALQQRGLHRELLDQGKVLAEQYPGSIFLLNLLGITHASLGEKAEAMEYFRRTVALKPDYADGHNNLGNVLRDFGRHEEAAAAYRRSIAIRPDQPQAHYNLATALVSLGEGDAAAASFRRAIMLKPDYAAAHFSLGNLLTHAGRVNEAITCFRRSVELRPDHAEGHNALGNALRLANTRDAAMASYKRAIEINPDHAQAHNNIGNLLNGVNQFDAALASYNHSIKLAPEYASARAHRLNLHAHICDWDGVALDAEWIPRLGTEGEPVAPFMMLAREDDAARHRIRAETLAAKRYARTPLPALPRPSRMPERLRIGYFSADFHNHATMFLMARMIELHDRDRFAIHAYSYGPDEQDAMRRRLVDAVEVFHDVRLLNDRNIADLARREKIDVAVDLKGYTQNTRSGILAFRPAPVQINYLGYPGTMGADFIDYIVADPVVVPEHLRHGYSEKVISLPHSYQCNDDQRVISDQPVSRADAGLPEDGFVFACFNNNYKITPDVFDIWMRLLTRIDGSVLWLMRANDRVEANLAKEAVRRGVDPSRLVFAPRVPLPEHLARHRLADLFVDTFNFNAHTTASDALWAGLPVLTKLGENFAARVAGSLLTAVGLPEMITQTAEDYEGLAVALATEPARLAAIRAKLAAQRPTAPLFDSALFTRHLEEGYRRAFQLYVDGLPPDHIDIAP